MIHQIKISIKRYKLFFKKNNVNFKLKDRKTEMKISLEELTNRFALREEVIGRHGKIDQSR